MRTRLLCALCGPIVLILLSGAPSGCSKAPSGAAAEDQQPAATHPLPSRQSAADAPLSDNSAATTPADGHAMTSPQAHAMTPPHGLAMTSPRGRAMALELDDGPVSSLLDRVEVHK